MNNNNNNNEVDVGFMQKVLRKYEKDDSIVVKDVHTEYACGKGENFMSVVLRVHVKGYKKINSNHSDFNLPLIVKRPYQSDVLDKIYHFDDIFRNEEIAYKEILPAMHQHLKYSIPTADCLYADRSSIILQDLSTLGFVMKQNQVCMTVAQCSVVLRELAVLHSASIILKQKDPKKVAIYASQIKDVYHINNIAIAEMVDKSFLSALILLREIKHPTGEIKHAIEVLKTHCKNHNIFDQVCQVINTKSDKNVFNHGDCWRNNILFKEISDREIEIKLLDLQIMRYTSVAADLSYFLYINLMPDVRNANKNYLLNLYFNKLRDTLSDHDINAEKIGYTRDWLEDEFNKFSVFGFMASLWIAPVFYFDKNIFPDMENWKPEEMDSAFIVDHMTPDLKKRMIAIMLDFTRNVKLT